MPDLIGKTLGPYRIIEQIGLGGMATVYKAYQPAMDRYVALKVLSTHLTQDPTFVKRFQQEAKVIAKLEHLHILPVYDHGEEEGYLYLVMRFIQAGTLKDRLEKGPLSLEEARRVVMQVGSALEYAHQLGVVHRDIKPSNVLIDPQGDCYLTDFGIAKMVEGTLGLTGSGVIGTPHYMAPEQGQSAKVDHRADVYATGVVIYEMVTGRVPFDAETPFAVVMKHITEPLPLPRSLRPDLPEGVERVILKAMAKAPADRYQSMRDLVMAFDQAVQAAPTEARTAIAPPRVAPMPTVVEEAEAEPTAVVPPPTMVPAWRQWAAAQPLWLLAVAGLGLLVLVLAGVILSRVPARVEISGGQVQVVLPTATATSAGEEAGKATPVSTPTRAAGALPTPSPTPATPPPPAVAGLRWEQLYDGKMFLSVSLTELAVDPHTPDTVFAGTYGAGIYVSRDGGQTWAPSNEGLGKGTVSTIAIDPNDSNVVYAATFDQGGVYKSTDGGRTWRPASTGIDLDRAWDWLALVYVDPTDSRRLYYSGVLDGFYLSTDGGQNWKRQSSCPVVTDIAVDPADFEHLYAASEEDLGSDCRPGVYETSDAGRTWKWLTPAEMVAPLADNQPDDVWHVTTDPRNFDIIYAGGLASTFKSSDGGRTWSRILGENCQWLETNPGDGTLYCGQGGQLRISRDGGASWSAISSWRRWSPWNSHPFAVAPNAPQILYAGTDTVLKSTDGGLTWLSVSRLGEAHMRLTVDPRDGNRLFLGGKEGPCETYRSEDGGRTWLAIATSDIGCSVVVDPAQNTLYRPSRWRGLYRSQDNGQTWEKFGSGYNSPWQLVLDPQDSRKLWLMEDCGARPLLSQDGGATFAEVASFPQEACGDPILLAHPNGKRMYVLWWWNFYRSDDGGKTWQRMGDLGGLHRAAALDPSDPDVAYFGSTHKGLVKTTDGGQTWSQANAGLTAPSINDLAIDPAHLQTIYAATDGGAFVSLDGGGQWQRIQEGLGPNPIVYSIAVDPNDSSKVYAVTPDGVFRLAGAPPVAAAPTPTAAPLSPTAEQARAFAEPILAAIKDHPPDYQDDFSDPASGWERGAYVAPDGWEEGERDYVDGEYYVSAPPAKPRPQKPDQPMTCASGHLISQRSFSDMVLEVEGRFVEVEDGNWHVILHQWHDPATDEGGEYKVMFEPNGHVSIGKLHSIDGHRNLAEMRGLPVQAGLEPNRLQILAVGPQIAVYVNGEPALFTTDPNFDERYKSGLFDLVVCNLGDTPLEVRWDNLRIWDISGLQLPAAEAAPTAPCLIAYPDKEKEGDIYVQDCDGSHRRRLTEHRGSPHEPAWSPDGQRLVFNAKFAKLGQEESTPSSIYIINADGSNLTRLTPPEGPMGDFFPTWSPDGSRIAFQRSADIFTIRPDGSDLVRVLYHRDLSGAGDPEMYAGVPVWSPDSRRIAFVTFPADSAMEPPPPGPYEYGFYVVNADGTGLIKLASFKLEVPQWMWRYIVWSPDGRQVAFEVTVDANGTIRRYQMNSDGSSQPVEIESIPESWFPWHWPQWGIQKAQVSATPTSAAACRIAFLNGDGNVYVRNCDGSGEMKITNLKSIIPPGVANNMLSWSPDGKYIVFQSIHEREPGNVDPLLYKVNADGSGLTRLTSGNRHDRFPVWSPAGKLIAFHSNCTLKTIAPDGSSEKTIVAAGTAEGTGICPNTVAWSPDSKQLAFVSWYDPFPENEKYILYVVNSDGTNLRKLRKFEGGAIPTWSPDGKQIGVEDMGNAYLLNADGSGEPVKVSSIPDSWHAWHWPQWGGE